MRIMVQVEVEVNLEGSRANIGDIRPLGGRGRPGVPKEDDAGVAKQHREGAATMLSSPSGRQTVAHHR